MKALLLGASGMLARDILREAPPDTSLIAPAEREADVTDESAMRAVIARAEPEVIINCAAYTNVDGAEKDRDLAFRVNGDALGVIGRAAMASIGNPKSATRNCLVVHYSTDYVFDGQGQRPYREDDATAPLGAYGASKLAGEQALAASGARYLIIRTSWLFGIHGRSFPRTMWQRATARQATRVVSDQVGRPTYTVDLARATWGLVGKLGAGSGKHQAIVHVANHGETTWYDVARRVFAAAGVPELVSPCTTAEYPTPARRPMYSVLDTSQYESLMGEPPPRWENAVDRFLREIAAEGAR